MFAMRILFLLPTLWATVIILTPVYGQSEVDIKTELDQLLLKTKDCRNFPSITAAIVQLDPNDQQNFSWTNAFGIRNPGPGEPNPIMVDSQTKFCIGPSTKQFTAGLLGKALIENGFNSTMWDTPLINLPLASNFYFDPVLSSVMTVKDILTHRTGIPEYLLASLGPKTPRDKLWDATRFMRIMKPYAKHFRSSFKYNSWMYVLAGHISTLLVPGEKKSWETRIKETYFEPLGMSNSALMQDLVGNFEEENIALHGGYLHEGTWHKPVPSCKQRATMDVIAAPSGSICSTGSDLIKYMEMMLSTKSHVNHSIPHEVIQGMMHGYSAIDRHASHLVRPHMAYSNTEESYGLGMEMGTYRGYKKLYTHYHEASNEFHSTVWLMPDIKLGLFLSATNSDIHTEKALAMGLIDIAAGFSPKWITNETICDVYPEKWAGMDCCQPPEPPIHHPIPEADLRAPTHWQIYLGQYRHPFGTIKVTLVNSSLYFTYGIYSMGILTKTREDIEEHHFTLLYDGPRKHIVHDKVSFRFNGDTAVGLIYIAINPADPPIFLKEVGPTKSDTPHNNNALKLSNSWSFVTVVVNVLFLMFQDAF